MLPATIAGIEKYLGTGLIKGIGPVTAKRIVRRFGPDTLRVIDEEPDRLSEALGVGQKRVALVKRAWEEQRQIKEVMIFLQSHGVSTGLAVKIYKHYGDAAVGVLKTDPYRLQRDIYGIGFLTADKIAEPGHPARRARTRGRGRGLCARPAIGRRPCVSPRDRTGGGGHRAAGGDPAQVEEGIDAYG